MVLLLERRFKLESYTIGKLFINGQYFCDTCEDKDRGLTDKMEEEEVKSKKIYGQTAIPRGIYQIDMNTISPKFKNRKWAQPYGGIIPRLSNVKGFEGVLIHPGNTAEDSLGCILVGLNKKRGQVINSQATWKELMDKFLIPCFHKGEKIEIEIY